MHVARRDVPRGETEIQAHKLVLAMQSPVFAAEFGGGMKEETKRRVTIHDGHERVDF